MRGRLQSALAAERDRAPGHRPAFFASGLVVAVGRALGAWNGLFEPADRIARYRQAGRAACAAAGAGWGRLLRNFAGPTTWTKRGLL